LATNPTLYGISNCDTVRKARRWLDTKGIAYDFHDLRADGIDRQLVRRWIDRVGWETVVNRRSSSWKELSAEQREAMDAAGAVEAITERVTLIKRPVFVHGEALEFGFGEARYRELIG
jgi:Spx/MgsR family transcriptional regulator